MTTDPTSPETLAQAIRRVADTANSEMDLQVKVEKLLDPFLPTELGVKFVQYGHSAKLGGIEDAKHGNLIIEYSTSDFRRLLQEEE